MTEDRGPEAMALPKETTTRSRRGTGAAARRDGQLCPAAMASGNGSSILSLLLWLVICRLSPEAASVCLCLDVRRCGLFIGWADGQLWVGKACGGLAIIDFQLFRDPQHRRQGRSIEIAPRLQHKNVDRSIRTGRFSKPAHEKASTK
jgi:hypothetical protein